MYSSQILDSVNRVSRSQKFTLALSHVLPEAASSAATAHHRVVFRPEALLALDPGLLLQSLARLVAVPVRSEVTSEVRTWFV